MKKLKDDGHMVDRQYDSMSIDELGIGEGRLLKGGRKVGGNGV